MCICQQYGKTDGLCPHVAAAAEKEGLLETFILIVPSCGNGC